MEKTLLTMMEVHVDYNICIKNVFIIMSMDEGEITRETIRCLYRVIPLLVTLV